MCVVGYYGDRFLVVADVGGDDGARRGFAMYGQCCVVLCCVVTCYKYNVLQ